MEGLARCPQKELSLALWADRGLCRLRVENTFDGTLLQDHEGNFKTRKAGTSLHGMGLDSVRRALSSLDGFYRYGLRAAASLPRPSGICRAPPNDGYYLLNDGIGKLGRRYPMSTL